MVQFYDNGDEVPAGWPGGDVETVIDVDRVYAVRADLTPGQWRRLDQIYRALPGGDAGLGSGAWFGPEDDPDGWLVASVEPSGLQVSGRLPVAQWQRWTAAFQAALDGARFPGHDFGTGT
ncbi:hypothetical protein AAG589_02605 [Isoptericola sp. F-RaC21]|uniref:hypothetical protein n=1 Tax=Isoptericola sp. F-RaC21 TaxID=3141452 RepID=UPI00315BABCF